MYIGNRENPLKYPRMLLEICFHRGVNADYCMPMRSKTKHLKLMIVKNRIISYIDSYLMYVRQLARVLTDYDKLSMDLHRRNTYVTLTS